MRLIKSAVGVAAFYGCHFADQCLMLMTTTMNLGYATTNKISAN